MAWKEVMTKQIVETVLKDITHELGGLRLSESIKVLQKYFAEYGDDATLEIDTHSDPYEDFEYVHVRIIGLREETDYEYEKRTRYETQHRDEEIRQLAYLKKKYEVRL
jgi:alkyl hydroperoxide reductase subunit AhpC